MSLNNSKKMIIRLKENGKSYLLFNDGSLEEENGKALNKDFDKELINRIMDRFKHGFTDDL